MSLQVQQTCTAEEHSQDPHCMVQWKLQRNIHEHATLPPLSDHWTNVNRLPAHKWLMEDDSPHYQKCRGLCFTWPQIEFLSCLRKETTALHTTEPVDDASDLEDIAQTIKFGSRIIVQLHFPSQPKLYYASAWRAIYHDFFDMARTDFFFCHEIEVQWPLPPPSSDNMHMPCDPSQITLATVIYQCVPCLPGVPGCLEYELIEADPEISQDVFSQLSYLNIPMVIIEYLDSALEGKSAVEHHKEHLLMAMSTGSSFYCFLKLKQPIFGFLIDAGRVEILIGYHSANSGVLIGQTEWNFDSSSSGMSYKTLVVFEMKNALHCLRLRLFLRQLVSHGNNLKDSYTKNQGGIINGLKNGTFYRWRAANQSLQKVGKWREGVPQPAAVVNKA